MKLISKLRITIASLALMSFCFTENVMADTKNTSSRRIPLTTKTLDQLGNVTNINGITEATTIQQQSNEIILAGDNSPMPTKIHASPDHQSVNVQYAQK